MNIYEKMGPTHNNQNSPGGPKKGGSVNITTPVLFHNFPEDVDVECKGAQGNNKEEQSHGDHEGPSEVAANVTVDMRLATTG